MNNNRNRLLFITALSLIIILPGLHSCSLLMRADKETITLMDGNNVASVEQDVEHSSGFVQSESIDQDFDYFKKDYQRTFNYIYMPGIQTIQLYRNGWVMTQPFIQINTDERLVLSFDDLADEIKDFRYTLVHCDANWQPSDLIPNEYLLGFTEGYIRDYMFSVNTIKKYVHYDLIFPTQDMQII